MAYAIVLPPDTANQIDAYVADAERHPTLEVQLAVLDRIRGELRKLSVNPKLGVVPLGPFSSRRVYRFRIAAGESSRHVQVMYKIFADRIVISGFEPVNL